MNKLAQFSIKQPFLSIYSKVKGSKGILWDESSYIYPVHRIYCVGRNYRDHAIEMGGNPDKEPPFFFMKPNDAIVDTTKQKVISYPTMTNSFHYEGELVVAIGESPYSKNLSPEQADEAIFGYAVGCDLTRRDLQSKAKKKGKPWDAAKGFDESAPCGAIVRKDDVDINSNTNIVLIVNGETRQKSTLDCMTWDVPYVISYLSMLFSIKAGDLIFTGTPAGVGVLNPGDDVSISCGDLPFCDFCISQT